MDKTIMDITLAQLFDNRVTQPYTHIELLKTLMLETYGQALSESTNLPQMTQNFKRIIKEL